MIAWSQVKPFALTEEMVKSAWSRDPNGVWFYQYDSMVAIINAISTLLSSLLPSTSIFILYFVQSPIARLAVIMVFTTVFSSTLVLVTKARRIDVFAATTAYVSHLSLGPCTGLTHT